MNVKIIVKRTRPAAAQPHVPVFEPLPFSREIPLAQIGAVRMLHDIPWYPLDSWHELAAARPRIIAGPTQSLLQLWQYVAVWNLDLSSCDTAIYCLTRLGERPLTSGIRDQLWDIIGLPVFELFLGGDGQVLARECEAHEGWHVNESAAEFTRLAGEPHLVLTRRGPGGLRFSPVGAGFSGEITPLLCPCGVHTPRLIDLPTEELWHEEEEAMSTGC